jgi:hypothetical protein
MKTKRYSSGGFSSVMAVIFVTLFSVLAISFTAMNDINVQMSRNHRDLYAAQAAAESGLEYAKYLIGNYVPPAEAYSPNNTVSESEAQNAFELFAENMHEDIEGSLFNNMKLRIPAIHMTVVGSSANFSLQFEFEMDPYRMVVTSTGNAGAVGRAVSLKFPIRKDTRILEFAVASRSRVIVTGDSTVEGDIYSTWGEPQIAPPFELEAESVVNGSLNTVLSEDDFDEAGYALEDKILGQHEGINYDQTIPEMPGMDASDYDTSEYASPAVTSTLPESGTTVVEYFPHVPGDYSQRSSWSSLRLRRQVYDGQTFTNVKLPTGRNSLFKNCTFEGILFVSAGDYGTNNIRFDNCTFNGAIVTSVPDNFKWKENMLYFTGSAIFNNQAMEESTILAPNFNVNIGNTQELIEGSESVLTGAIVGGIVDIRGNANVNGTILSMYDPTSLGGSAGAYATNVGFSDENEEAGVPEDIGTIHVTPNPDRLLPSGMVTPVIIDAHPDANSYVEL